MTLGLTPEKLLLVLLVAVMIIGPERLPRYTSRLAQLARATKRTMQSAQDRMREQMGPEFDDIDWKKLDPRQYDPRQIVRNALIADDAAAPRETASATAPKDPQAETPGPTS